MGKGGGVGIFFIKEEILIWEHEILWPKYCQGKVACSFGPKCTCCPGLPFNTFFNWLWSITGPVHIHRKSRLWLEQHNDEGKEANKST